MIYVKDTSAAPLIGVTQDTLKEYVQRYYYRNEPSGEKSINIEFDQIYNSYGSIPLILCVSNNMYALSISLVTSAVYKAKILGDSNITNVNIIPNSSTGGKRVKIELDSGISTSPQILSLRRGITISNIWLM